MSVFLKTFCAAMVMAGAGQAATLTFDFSGNTTSNPGLAGSGPFAGTITYDTDAATFVGSGEFQGIFSAIDFAVNGVNIDSGAAPSTNRLTQVRLPSGNDAFLSTFSDSFEASGVAGVIVSDVSFEVRMEDGRSLFSDPDILLDSLSDGDTFDIDDFSFVSLVVRYDSGSALDATILRLNAFDTLNATFTGDVIAPVPLPAGLPLAVLGLAGLGALRRRKG